ncbi:MAG: PEP-CTERM sorting domain-containing protein [Sphingobium sp.]|nr:PEP-CTERM sorting domain-containing protein [Sphingobium sp.]
MKSALRTVLLATLAASAADASASTVYTDRTAFLAAVSGVSTDTFEENVAGSFTYYPSQYDGAGFTITGGPSFTVDPAFNGSLYQWNSGDVFDAELHNLTVTAGAGIKGLGFDFGLPNDYHGTGIVTINGVDYAVGSQPNFNFFGIVDDAGVGAVSLDFHGGLGILDNLSIARETAGAVPEPASWAMMIGGLAVVGGAMRRRATKVSFA